MVTILTWWTILFILGIIISVISTGSVTDIALSSSALVALIIPITIFYIQWMMNSNIFREHYIGFTLGALGIISISFIIFFAFVLGLDIQIHGPAKYIVLYTISLIIAIFFGLLIGSMWDPSEVL
jgi:hypothetical protein